LKPPKLSPEEKIHLAIDMSNSITQICLDGIKSKHPNITEKETIKILRERLQERRT
jgi:hypothetical protein